MMEFVGVPRATLVLTVRSVNALVTVPTTGFALLTSNVSVTLDSLVSTAHWLIVHLVAPTMASAEMASASATKASMELSASF